MNVTDMLAGALMNPGLLICFVEEKPYDREKLGNSIPLAIPSSVITDGLNGAPPSLKIAAVTICVGVGGCTRGEE